jgi:hypothetical protein
MRNKITIKRLVSIGSLLSLGGLALTIQVNKDLRTQVYQKITEVREVIAPADTLIDTILVFEALPAELETLQVEVQVLDSDLAPAVDGLAVALSNAIEELQAELGEIASSSDSLEVAVELLGLEHEIMIRRFEGLVKAQADPRIFIVIDSLVVPVDIDSIQGAAGWLRALWPWLKDR